MRKGHISERRESSTDMQPTTTTREATEIISRPPGLFQGGYDMKEKDSSRDILREFIQECLDDPERRALLLELLAKEGFNSAVIKTE